MGAQTKPKGNGVDACRRCGSADLFDGYFKGRQQYEYAADVKGATYRTVCNTCGYFQDAAPAPRR